MSEVLDFVGRAITAGCTVIYPVRRGSDMRLHRMQVQQVVPGDGKRSPCLTGFNSVGRRVSVQNVENVIVAVPIEAVGGVA